VADESGSAATPSVLAWRVSPADGGVLDPVPLTISTRGALPAAASDGLQSVVGWVRGNAVQAARIDRDGGALGPVVVTPLVGQLDGLAAGYAGQGATWLVGR